VVDLGAVEITSDEKTPIYWSPITGGIILATGLLTFFASRKKNRVDKDKGMKPTFGCL
jgi:hypothetical protein